MDKKAIFRAFIAENEILVVDKNLMSRNRLQKILHDLGSPRGMVHVAGSFSEAEEIVQKRKIGLVLSEYFITGGSGFELFNLIKNKESANKKLCLVLVTSNLSQTAVSKAAEEDVDSFIIKPYTVQSMEENLSSTIAAKVAPSDYMEKITQGKEYLLQKDYENALEVLSEATTLHPSPALALFYIGQVDYLQSQLSDAKDYYNQGLSFNNIHYKCLLGLYDLFMREQKFNEAYLVVKKIAKIFPANQDRLAQIVRLAIRTENFKDMESFYDVFTSLEDKTSHLTNFMGSGLYVSGKYYLINEEAPKAFKHFDHMTDSCSEFTKFYRATVSLLIEHNYLDDAQRYFSKFPISAKHHPDYLVSDFLMLASKKHVDQHMLIKKGLEIYNLNIRDYRCMSALVGAMEASGYQEDKLNSYRREISLLWPDKIPA